MNLGICTPIRLLLICWITTPYILTTSQALAQETIVSVLRHNQKLMFTGLIPASTTFVLELPTEQKTTGTVKVWPALSDCSIYPEENTKQSYELAMSPYLQNQQHSLRATIPPLQVNQPFCFEITVAGNPAEDTIDYLKTSIIKVAIDDFITSCTADKKMSVLTNWLNEEFNRLGLSGEIQPITDLVYQWLTDQKVTYRCKNYLQKYLQAEATIEQLAKRKLDRDTLLLQISRLEPLRESGPSPGRLMTFQCNQGVINADNIRKNPLACTTSVLEQLTAIKNPTALQKEWSRQFRGLKNLETNIDEATIFLANTQKKMKEDLKSLKNPKLPDQNNSQEDIPHLPDRIDTLFSTEMTWALRSRATTKTLSAGSYISPDVGVLIGAPIHKEVFDLWLLPYLGVNLYLTPVERRIPLSELVGATWKQRLSLTIGATLSAPADPKQTIKPLFLERYPLIALGFRMTHYSRITIGSLFCFVGDANPASKEDRLVAAPFISLSLDADLFELIEKKFR